MRQSAQERQHTRRGGSQTGNPENVQHEVAVEHAKRKAGADTDRDSDEQPNKKPRLALIKRVGGVDAAGIAQHMD